MFDIGWGELVLIGMVALIVIGPKELPTVLRALGQWMTKIRRMAGEFQGQFQEAMREAELADLKKQVDSIADPTAALSSYNPLEVAKNEVESAFADADKPRGSDASEPSVDEPAPLPAELGGLAPDAAQAPTPSDALAPAGPAEAAQAEPAASETAPAEPAAAEPTKPAGPPPASEGGRAA